MVKLKGVRETSLVHYVRSSVREPFSTFLFILFTSNPRHIRTETFKEKHDDTNPMSPLSSGDNAANMIDMVRVTRECVEPGARNQGLRNSQSTV